MISEQAILRNFKGFADSAMPLLFIKSDASYDDALHLLEKLFEQTAGDESGSEQYLISLLSQAIADYEDNDPDIQLFMQELKACVGDVAVLKTLIEQHHLTLDALPEIGHKSLVSKILSGQRQLTKKHIKGLSQRFSIEPSLFF